MTKVTIPNGTQSIVGNGSLDTANLSADGPSTNFQITSFNGGSFLITDTVNHTLVDTETTGIAYVQFADKTIRLADASHVAQFAPGVTTMTIPNGTQLVLGNGGSDILDLSPNSGYSYYYSITANTDGTYSVSFTHGTALKNTELVGISAIKFQDKTVALTPSPHTVIFPAGTTSLAIPAGTLQVVGNGGTDTADLSAGGASTNFSISANADGTYTVLNKTAASPQPMLVAGISALKFTDGTLTLGSGQIASTTTSSSSGTGTGTTTPTPTGPTVTFAPGVDSLAIPGGTGFVVGNGDANDVAIFPDDHSHYTMTVNSDGSVSVTDTSGAYKGTHLTNVATLQFSDGWTYNVATHQFPAVAAVGAAENSTLASPAIPTASGGVITNFQIENTSHTAAAAQTVTFGQVFADGDVPAGQTLTATINGQTVALQVDVKSHYADGSVATAELTLTAPQIAANGSIQVSLAKTAVAQPAAAAIDPHTFVAKGYDTQVAFTFHNADGTTSTTSINAATALTQALAAGTATTWLSGPQAGEVQVNVPINGSMHVLLNIRGNADGTFLTDVQVANDGILSAAAVPYTYDVAITSHGQTSYSQAGITQAPMQEWHQLVYSNATGPTAAPADSVIFNAAYLEKTGAVEGFDLSSGLSAEVLENQYAQLLAGHSGVLSTTLVDTQQPDPGSRPDIGPINQWAAEWLVTQNPAAEQIMLQAANAMGSAPIHATNPDGSVVNLTNDPNLWLDWRATGNQAAVNNFNTVRSETGWDLDTAHMYDLDSVAAMTQGSQYYLQQVQDQANYDILQLNPGYRTGGGIVDHSEVRGVAWVIRDFANAAFLTPDSDPQKAYFTNLLESTINHILTEYVNGPLGTQEGQLYGYITGNDPTEVAPWQEGYLAIEMAHAAQLGFAGAAQVCAWENNFITGLFLNGSNGYNPLNGPGYWLNTGSTVNGTFVNYTTWQQFYQGNFTTTPTTLLEYNPADPTGTYPAILKAALASLWDVTGSPNDLAAYAYLTRLTSGLITATSGYTTSPDWNITPTLSDGHHLLNSEVYYGNGGVTTAATPNGLLAAVTGNNVLNAGSAASILIGGDGTDTLNGGAGNDYLFAGNGTQTLYGAGGTNYLKGGTGVDTFVFHLGDVANDTIVGFKPGVDHIQIVAGGLAITLPTVLAGVTVDAQGDAVLHLTLSHEVTLQGITPAQLTSALFSLS